MIKKIDYTKYINYALIVYAFSFPISKAGTNLFEILAIVLWILEGNWKEKFALYKQNILSIAIALLIGFSLLSILWHGNAELTFKYVVKYRHLLIIFVFYSSFDKKYASYILSAFLVSMFISELMSYAIFFELIHYKNISPSDPTPFMSHMTYSTLLAFTVNVLLVRFFYEKDLKYKFFYIFFFLTATINLFINGGKTGQIIFIVLILVTVFASVKHKLKAFAISMSTLFIAFFLAYNYSPNFHNRANQLYSGVTNMVNDNNFNGPGGYRTGLSIIGINTYLQNPILGTGIAYNIKNPETNITNKMLKIINVQRFADYHSAFITISVQLGIVGLIISLLILYSLLTFKIQNKEYKLLSLLFAISFIMFSFTHNTLHTMNPMVFFALFGGFFNSLTTTKTIQHNNKTTT